MTVKEAGNTGKPFCSAVVVAAGQGTRMNMDINKQYIQVRNKPVLARAISIFEDCGMIEEIIVVVNSQDIMYCRENIIDKYRFKKVKAIVAGGAERQNSVYNGLLQVDRSCDIVLIHDGARPFTKQESVLESINAASKYGASCVAVPVKDTIKKSSDQGFVNETVDRKNLWSIQTPQTFKYELIMGAHERAGEDNFIGTDDAVLVERMGRKMKLVMGSYDNIKITTVEDLTAAEAIAVKNDK